MRHRSTLLAALALGGCNLDPDQLFNYLEGREVNLVVLSNQPLQLSQQTLTLTSSETMKVVGQSTYVCLALQSNTELVHVAEMENTFQQTMHGAKVKVNVLLASGKKISLREPLEAWRMYGRILGRGELSACATVMQCEERWPVGAFVTAIEITSEPSLRVNGVFWESQRGPLEQNPLEKAPRPSQSAVSTETVPKSTCHS